jgi:hypothetical protein
MALDEYLEKLAAEGYRQQLADEENVPRSLPFFAASLAVLVAILGAVKEWIPAPSWSVYPVVIWLLLGALAASLLLIMYFLRESVRKRDFIYVMDENALADYVTKLRRFYELNTSLAVEESEAAILADLQAELGRQHRDAAVNNRLLNFRKARARATAFEVLVFALLLAFVIVATILWQHSRTGDPDARRLQSQDRGSAQTGQPDGRPGTGAPQADPAAAPGGQEGRVFPLGALPKPDPAQNPVTGAPASPAAETPLPASNGH